MLYPEAFPEPAARRLPSAGWLARAVAEELAELHDPEPLYLRRPDAVAPGAAEAGVVIWPAEADPTAPAIAGAGARRARLGRVVATALVAEGLGAGRRPRSTSSRPDGRRRVGRATPAARHRRRRRRAAADRGRSDPPAYRPRLRAARPRRAGGADAARRPAAARGARGQRTAACAFYAARGLPRDRPASPLLRRRHHAVADACSLLKDAARMTDEPLVLGIETLLRRDRRRDRPRPHAARRRRRQQRRGARPLRRRRARGREPGPPRGDGADHRAGLRDRRHPALRRRRDRGHQRPRPGRCAARRRRGGQGAGDRARQADLRRQPPRRARRRRPARARRRCPSRAWRCWSAAATPACSGSRTSPAGSSRWARRSTTRRGRRSTRSRGCSGCRSPAARTSTARPATGQVTIDFPRGLTGRRDLERHRFDFSFSGLKTAVARWVETQQRDGVADRRRRRGGQLPGGGLRRAGPQGDRRRHRPGHRGHPDRRRRRRELPAARDGRPSAPRPRGSGSASRGPACAPTTARWWRPSAPSWSPAGAYAVAARPAGRLLPAGHRGGRLAGGEHERALHVLALDRRYGVLHRAVRGEPDDGPLPVLEDRREHLAAVLPLRLRVERPGLLGAVASPQQASRGWSYIAITP